LISNDIFHSWVRNLFPSVKYEGVEYRNRYPTIKVSTVDFEENKMNIPVNAMKNIVRIRGSFNAIEYLSLGVRDFDNDLRTEDFFTRFKNDYKS